MSMGLERIRERVAEYLSGQGVSVCTAWPVSGREKLSAPVTVVSLRGCQVGPSGFQDYLGERYNEETRQWEELYGRKAKLTFGLDLYAPASVGEMTVQTAFDALAQALTSGSPSGLEVQELSCGETEYDRPGRLLKRSAQVVCGAYLYAVAQPGGAFLDFEIRGEGNI